MSINSVDTMDMCCWSLEQLSEALHVLAGRSALLSSTPEALPAMHVGVANDIHAWQAWLTWSAKQLNLEVESVSTPYMEVRSLLQGVGPAIWYIHHGDVKGFLLILATNQTHVTLIDPNQITHRISIEKAFEWSVAPYEAVYEPMVAPIVAQANIPSSQQSATKSALYQDYMGEQLIGRCWQLRAPNTQGLWAHLTQSKLPTRFAIIVSLVCSIYLLEASGWGLIGHVTMGGRPEIGWLVAWLLLMVSLIPLQMTNSWISANFALDIGRIVKQRLLAATLHADVETTKSFGTGQMLARVMESQALESLAMNGGLSAVFAMIELALAAAVLSLGASATWHLGLLALFVMMTLVTTSHYCHSLYRWTLQRFQMTHYLVQQMLGHRTRLAQEPAHQRNLREDNLLHGYWQQSKSMDQAIVPVMGLLPSAWMVAGLLGLAPVFIGGEVVPTDMAISLGGMLLANRALSGVSNSLTSMARAGIAWQQIAKLLIPMRAKPSRVPMPSPQLSAIAGASTDSEKTLVIDASQLVYHYPQSNRTVINGVDLQIYAGDRVLIQGASGGGKSTLASLLVGLREQNSGLLLLNGLDKATLGEDWHQWITEAPQFHENHIFNGSLAYNLLMGRTWPATESDMHEAQQLCEELGLSGLLARMPAGLMQMVGESGWQLSHGERSRIFLARALLQKAKVTVLDESFAALDPATLKQCLTCAFKHAQTLIVIAHP